MQYTEEPILLSADQFSHLVRQYGPLTRRVFVRWGKASGVYIRQYNNKFLVRNGKGGLTGKYEEIPVTTMEEALAYVNTLYRMTGHVTD